jgi:hypothetical protein
LAVGLPSKANRILEPWFRLLCPFWRSRREIKAGSGFSIHSAASGRLAVATQKKARGALNHLERVLDLGDASRLGNLNAAALSKFQTTLRAEGMLDPVLASHLRHLRGALR